MKLILLMAFRNLFRHKSRSVLIGLGICASTIFLVMGYSLNKGMFKNLINNFVESNIFGHCTVNTIERFNETNRDIIRDRSAIVSVIKDGLSDIKDVRESLNVPAYAMYSGKGSGLGLTGIPAKSMDKIRNMEIVEGDFEKFFDGSIENPFILEQKRAKALKARVGDVIRVRLSTIYGQVQTARLNLVAIVRLTNPMMASSMQGVLPLERLKEITGYRSHETKSLNVVLKDLKESDDMIRLADRVSELFKPGPAFIKGEFRSNGTLSKGVLAGIKSDKASVERYYKQIRLLDGKLELFEEGKGTIHISKSLADIFDLKSGSPLQLSYKSKYDGKEIILDFQVIGIIDDPGIGISNVAFIDDETFLKAYLNDLPANETGIKVDRLIVDDNPFITCLAPSWRLAERTYSVQEYGKKQREIRLATYNGRILDVVTMQETIDAIFKMESMQETSIIFIMLIVLSIILVGVVNTTRMNIQERVREIGTIRAIGMQRKSAVLTLIVEIQILCVLSVLIGILSSWGLMEILSLIRIHTDDFYLSTILNNGRLLFKSPIGIITANILLIHIMTFIAVYFPAKKAVNKPVADALGHYE